MSGITFWLIIAVIFVLLWWAGFYATKDMRVKKNALREKQAKRNLELHAQQQAEAASETAVPATDKIKNSEANSPKDAS